MRDKKEYRGAKDKAEYASELHWIHSKEKEGQRNVAAVH